MADTRARLLAAATATFAADGYAGANVDRIARRARVNKAMIYYHFRSKVGLYREVVRGLYRAIGQRVWAIVDSRLPPEEKLAQVIAAIVEEAAARPDLPRIVLREMAEKGRHLDAATLQVLARIPQGLAAILAEGVSIGVFRPVPPFTILSTIAGPIIFFFASAPVRARLGRLGVAGAAELTSERLVRHLQQVALDQVRREGRQAEEHS